MKKLPVIILGAGGHSRVLIDTLLLDSTEILGMTDVNLERQELLGVPLLGNDLIVDQYSPENIQLINLFPQVISTHEINKSKLKPNHFHFFINIKFRN